LLVLLDSSAAHIYILIKLPQNQSNNIFIYAYLFHTKDLHSSPTMCCRRRNNQRVLTVAKLIHDQPITTSRAAHLEPLGPPPAYEQIEKDSQAIKPSKGIHTAEVLNNQDLTPEYTARDANIGSPSNNTTMQSVRPTCQSRFAAKREKKQLKRAYRQENRLEKQQYRQEKRELRNEYRFEKQEMRRNRGGPISMLIKGVSNLMKQ